MHKTLSMAVAVAAALVVGVGTVAADTEMGHTGLVGTHPGAVVDLRVFDAGDLLVAQSPERVQQPGGEPAVAVVDDLAGGVLADHPVLIPAAGGGGRRPTLGAVGVGAVDVGPQRPPLPR